VKRCSVVTKAKRKLLIRLGQKARGQVRVLRTHPAQMASHRRTDATSPTLVHRRNVATPVVFPASHATEEGKASRKSGPRDSGSRIGEKANAAR
jgi:hypothetical protein